MTMLTDGIKSQNLEEKIKQMDVAELLAESCIVDEPVKALPQDDAMLPVPGTEAESTVTASAE
jgi:hypothetical protein